MRTFRQVPGSVYGFAVVCRRRCDVRSRAALDRVLEIRLGFFRVRDLGRVISLYPPAGMTAPTEASTFRALTPSSSTTLSSSVRSATTSPVPRSYSSSTVPATTPSFGLYSTCNSVFPTSNGIPMAVVKNSEANSCAMSENVRDSSGSVGSISTPANVEDTPPPPRPEEVVEGLVANGVEALDCLFPVGGRNNHSSCGGAATRGRISTIPERTRKERAYCRGSSRKQEPEGRQPLLMLKGSPRNGRMLLITRQSSTTPVTHRLLILRAHHVLTRFEKGGK